MTKEHPDKIQREIEELLDSLDNFVPEERLAAKIKARTRRPEGEPSPLQKLLAPFRRITLGHLMLAGLGLLVLTWLLDMPYERWLMLLGVGLTVVAFVLSVARSGGSRSPVFRQTGGEKRWRGQVIQYGEPTAADRVRGWFRGLRRR